MKKFDGGIQSETDSHDELTAAEMVKAAMVVTSRRQLRQKGIVGLYNEITSEEAEDVIQDILCLVEFGAKEIRFNISSEGGSLYNGMGVVRAVRLAQSRGVRVIGHVYGQAQSMAFFILQYCDERVMGVGDILMCHGVSLGIHGDIRDMEAEKKQMDFFQELFASLLSTRCTAKDIESKYRDPVTWADILLSNTPVYFTSEEAMEYGLVDRVE
jgi:ATP-dependent protease ClpP protease subunit